MRFSDRTTLPSNVFRAQDWSLLYLYSDGLCLRFFSIKKITATLHRSDAFFLNAISQENSWRW